MPEKKNTIGRFEIIEKIGEGPIGAVYKALDPVIRRTVAIKVIKLYALEESTTFAEVFEKIYRVVRTSTALNHPNICIIYDLSEEKKIPYVTMEYVDGHDIDSLLEQKHQFKRTELLKILQQTCDALDFAHKKNVVHQDLKATNILITPDLHVKITDFGLAGLDEIAAAQTKKLLSIPYYISPEQALGEKITASSDLFSLGVVTYQLLSGQLPFPGNSAANVIMMIARNDPAVPKDLRASGIDRKAWDAFFARALAKRPAQRFQNGHEMFEAVSALLPASPQTYFPYVYSGALDSTDKFEKTFVGDVAPAEPTQMLEADQIKRMLNSTNPELTKQDISSRPTLAPSIPLPPVTEAFESPVPFETEEEMNFLKPQEEQPPAVEEEPVEEQAAKTELFETPPKEEASATTVISVKQESPATVITPAPEPKTLISPPPQPAPAPPTQMIEVPQFEKEPEAQAQHAEEAKAEPAPKTELISIPGGAAATIISAPVFEAPPTQMIPVAHSGDGNSGGSNSAATAGSSTSPPVESRGYKPPVISPPAEPPPASTPAQPTVEPAPKWEMPAAAAKPPRAGAAPPKMGRYLVGAIVVAFLIAAVGLAIFFGRKPATQEVTQNQVQPPPVQKPPQQKPLPSPPEASPAPAAASTGILTVNSAPPGATVLIDGVESGITPFQRNDIQVGKHQVKLKLKGYNDVDQELEVTPEYSGNELPPITLQRAAPVVGTLVVESNPSGAFIVLGNKVLGMTPKTLTNQKPGKYDIILKKDGYQDYSGTVRVVKDKTATFEGQLAEIPKPVKVVEAPKPKEPDVKPGMLVTLGPGVVPPRAIKKSYARYPAAAKQKRLEGTVGLSLLISETGKVAEVKITQSANPVLDEAALKAVREWIYEPATKEGVPVKVWIPLSISFQGAR